ncbi:MAG: division/cell wall cluster transcriptional repressor MraZ [Dehalococcoidales bacterium]|nr:division/cell wall cluster transcriptional repressor MraZ [Dehalococcoidales bacterium]
MFFGEFAYKIDEKGRMPIPPRFRNSFKDGIVLTPGPEKCIIAYTAAEWKKLAASFTATTPLTPSKMRKLNRAIFATAFSTIIDGQGRIALPVPLRDSAEIKDDVVIAGANTYLEIWDKDLWEEEKASSQEQAWQIIESLEKR